MNLSAERAEFHYLEFDRPREACGVFGIYGPGEPVAHITYEGLKALQHRGQEGAGIDTATPIRPLWYKNLGLVTEAFHDTDILRQLEGSHIGGAAYMAIGHTRYSTTGGNRIENLGPFRVEDVAVAHNGNLTNARFLRERLKHVGFQPVSTTDSELIAYSIAHASGRTWSENIIMASHLWRGTYSLVISTPEGLFAVRDPMGNRPLCIGRFNNSGWVAASETIALEQVGAAFHREVEPGEICLLSKSGVQTVHFIPSSSEGLCIFEYVYLSYAGSELRNIVVNGARIRLGHALAEKEREQIDLVIDIPDNGRPYALGFSHALGIPYDEAILRNRYYGRRTFIDPDQGARHRGSLEKYRLLPGVIEGKRIAVVDDSIVRGTTTKRLVGYLFERGAREVHLRIGSAPIKHPCHYGVDMATYEELAAHGRSTDRLRQEIGATTLTYLTVDEMTKAIGVPTTVVCAGCFTGTYPEPVDEPSDKYVLEDRMPLHTR